MTKIKRNVIVMPNDSLQLACAMLICKPRPIISGGNFSATEDEAGAYAKMVDDEMAKMKVVCVVRDPWKAMEVSEQYSVSAVTMVAGGFEIRAYPDELNKVKTNI